MPFRVVRSRYEENNRSSEHPVQLVLRHARGKARAAMIAKKSGLVLGADTIVWRAGKIYSKPKNMRAAEKMLGELSGRTHTVLTGLALRDLATGREIAACGRTRVRMKKLTPAQIRAFFKAVNPLDKAGAYAIQEGPKIVASIQGSFSNVVGLPVELLNKMLRQFHA